ncbi:MAG: alanine--tRNA ligase [Firmicutes bacterium]|nr:alanine--tRNA ligase [Bacillota bacterium]
MQYMGVNEIREKYLSFFETKQHLRLASASLVPQNDKSLLLINSGMAPLKPFFTGQQVPPRKRVTTCQKCIRTGDIENVGKTARHGTFFEMLGNFSFGDYFKNEAIEWAWEFFTKVIKLPEDKLYVSIYQDDDEAFDIWHKKIGLAEDRIFRMGKEDNFWEHGVGPCGPCSEIYYDKGPEYGCGKPGCTVGCDCDRYMEVWNLVFTQFCKEDDGSYSNLDHPNIDTGMGLERLATVMQGVNSIFDVDTVKAIRDKVCEISGKEYGKEHKYDVSIRVITDHVRSVTFMTSDGVMFSNEGRGYVLRRLLRRAVRHGKLLGIDRKFIAEVADVVIENSGDAYPELKEKREYIKKMLSVEESRFHETLDTGMAMLAQKIDEIKAGKGENVLEGADSFKLYDTYGFPLDLMQEILGEEGITVDEDAFRAEMEKQRTRAREARETDTYMGAEETVFHQLPAEMSTEFVGYDNNEFDGKVLALVSGNAVVDTAGEGNDVAVVVDKTPFYAEMGGQVGDTGVIESDGCKIEITDCTKFGGNKFIHTGKVISGEIKVGDTVTLKIDTARRKAIARNHTATHLLQAALREVLGSHIEQAGSYVSDTRLRFDFTHFESIDKETLVKVERIVNDKIFDALDVVVKEMPIEEAKKSGATALFGEKYGDTVRVVNVGGYSVEFCGGTHLHNSSEAGVFKIISESGVAAGVRRIEATTGENVLHLIEEREYMLSSIGTMLKAAQGNIVQRISAVLEENKQLTKELEALKAKMSGGAADEMINSKVNINGVAFVAGDVKGLEMNDLRTMGDKLKDKLSGEAAVIVLASGEGSKVSFVVMCTDDAVKKGAKAGDIVKAAATVCGGGGGGRPNMAQAGGKDASKIKEALEAAKAVVEGAVK